MVSSGAGTPLPKRFVWVAVAVLVAIGATAGIARVIHPADLASRLEPVRARAFAAARRVDTATPLRMAELRAMDERYGRHRTATLLHVVPGTAFLLLAPLQLSSRLRRRRPRAHRWIGRILIVVGSITGLVGLWFGLVIPFAGWGERVPIALAGGAFLIALWRGFAAIRRRDPRAHREWMVRAFAVALGISVVRLVGLPLDLILAPAGVGTKTIFVISLWSGWLAAAGASELWLARGRRRLSAEPQAATVAA